MSGTRGQCEMRFGDGEVLRAWTAFTLRDSFLDPLGDMQFTARPPRNLVRDYRERLERGELVAIMVNGHPQGVQLIQDVKMQVGQEGVVFDVSCQTPLCTTYEASAPPDYTFNSKTDVPISSVINDIMRPYFGPDTEVYIDAGDDVAARLGKKVKHGGVTVEVEALKHKDCQVQEGETVYALCDRLVNRLGMILKVDVGGRLYLTHPHYDQAAQYTLVQSFLNTVRGDRMLDGHVVAWSNRNQFSECVVRGERHDSGDQSMATQPGARVTAANVLPFGASAQQIAQLQEFFDKGAKNKTIPFLNVVRSETLPGLHGYRSLAAPYKPRFFKDKKIRDAQRAQSLAKLILGVKSKDSFYVECEVDGLVSLSNPGAIWSVDTVARVVSEAAGIDEDMWVLETVKQLSHDAQRTKLKLIPLNSLMIGDLPGG